MQVVQLGVEFGSKLIYIPEEDKTVKLQCVYALYVPVSDTITQYITTHTHTKSNNWGGWNEQAGIPRAPNPFVPSHDRITAAQRAAYWSTM